MAFRFICDVLCDLVPFIQFKKREKHLWRSVNTSPWFFSIISITELPAYFVY